MEQMLDAHDGLISLEEQPLLEAARTSLVKTATADYPEYLHKDLSLADISQARQVYWDSAAIALGVALGKELGEALGEKLGQRRLLDKLPLNIVHLPLIRRIFPDAPVLVALRDPRDVVLSCFMQSFEPNEAMVHFRDVVSAANLYAGVMSNWLTQRDLFGPHIFEYKYEDLVADPETIMRAVFGFLGLPWQQTVLDYHARRRNRLVATPSYQDVSEKIYDRAIARWQTYTEPLEPVLEPLAPFVKAFGYEPGGYSGKPALRSPSA
jgi:hypothetical protein